MKQQIIIIVCIIGALVFVVVEDVKLNKNKSSEPSPTVGKIIENKLPDEVKHIKLAPEIEKELGDIMRLVMATPGEPTQTTKSKFWSIIQENGVSAQDINDTREVAVGPAVDYMKTFYQDALESLKTGKFVKSTERKQREDSLLQSGIITQEQYEKNQRMLENIAIGLSVTTPQGDIIFTEYMINNIIQSIDEQRDRVNLLLSK